MNAWEKSILLALAIVLTAYLFRLTKKRKLHVELALYWVVIITVMIGCLMTECDTCILSSIGLTSSLPAALLVISILGLVWLLLNLYIHISEIKTVLKELVQEVSLLKFRQNKKKNSK